MTIQYKYNKYVQYLQNIQHICTKIKKGKNSTMTEASIMCCINFCKFNLGPTKDIS